MIPGTARTTRARCEHHGRRRRDVERVHAVRHRDRHDTVGGLDRAGAEPVALRAEHEREPVWRVGREVAERHGVVGQRERRDREPVGVQHPCRLGPLGQPCPRHLEHRAHADAHAAPVEGVGAPGRHEHRVRAEGGDRAEDRADVGVIDDVLEHHDPSRAREQLTGVGHLGALERGEGATVHAVPGDRLELLGLGEVHGDVEGVEHRLQPWQPFLVHEHRPRTVPGADGTADDLRGLGDVQAVGGLVGTAQGHVGESRVVGHGVGCRVADTFDVHGPPPLQPASARNNPENRRV